MGLMSSLSAETGALKKNRIKSQWPSFVRTGPADAKNAAVGIDLELMSDWGDGQGDWGKRSAIQVLCIQKIGIYLTSIYQDPGRVSV